MTNAFHEFIKTLKPSLVEQFPEYSKGHIHKIAIEEWKKSERGASASIISRLGTMKYEFNKTLILRIPQYNMCQHDVWREFCEKNKCIYCNKSLKSRRNKSKGDHFLAVQSNSDAPLITNFSAFTMPCCVDCNTSRGKKDVFSFIQGDITRQCNKELLQTVKTIIDMNIEYYNVADKSEYEDEMAQMYEFLRTWSKRAYEIEMQRVTVPMSNLEGKIQTEDLIDQLKKCTIESNDDQRNNDDVQSDVYSRSKRSRHNL